MAETEYPADAQRELRYCSLPPEPPLELDPALDPARAALIRVMANKWVNGTVLHYYFFEGDDDGEEVLLADGTREWRTWVGADDQKEAVRTSFGIWKDVGIGLELEEVASRSEAEVRIGFMRGDGAWSYVGTYVLEIGADKRTMNLGWDVSDDLDTPVHEIGHTLGFPHEHQNPHAGIVWNEEAVYAALAAPPNRWSRDKTHYNIIRKIPPDEVQGSEWDPSSVMHYPFGAGLIDRPEQYRNGLFPAGGLSARDRTWVQTFYPPLEGGLQQLVPFQSVALALGPGEQKDFAIEPQATRYYDIRTFGLSDTVVVLFEDDGGNLRYVTADDDSGQDTNASLRVKLFAGRRYVLRIRLYWADVTGETAVMMW
ncbi:MAG TPA: M12 family metallopeptidase [Gemmatimonadaceae bacterium]|nr:M12 family metallopeptidase [Gemmatimonadaceae bacterium]